MENYWLYYALNVLLRLAVTLLILWPGVRLWKQPERIRPKVEKLSQRFEWVSDELPEHVPTIGGGLARIMVVVGGILAIYTLQYAWVQARPRKPGSFMEGVVPYQMPAGVPGAPQPTAPADPQGMAPPGAALPPGGMVQPGYDQPGYGAASPNNVPTPPQGVPGARGGYGGGY